MDEEAEMRVQDAVNAAALLLEAVENGPNRAFQTVESEVGGRADVALDGAGIDVDLHDRDATVHVRFDGGDAPEGRGR